MSTTTIKRKALRNRVKAKQRKATIKRLSSKPILKNIDVEAIKSTFGKTDTKKTLKKTAVSEKDNNVEAENSVAITEDIDKKELQPKKPKAEKSVSDVPVKKTKSNPTDRKAITKKEE